MSLVSFAHAQEKISLSPNAPEAQLNAPHADQRKTNSDTLNDDNILKSIDDISTLLDNQIGDLDTQKTLSSPAKPVSNNSALPTDSTATTVENIDSLDKFDDLALDDVFNDTLLGRKEPPENEISSLQDQITLSNNKAAKILPQSAPNDNVNSLPQSVGIQGNEEKTINKLDDSNLMDYLKDKDIWQKDVVDDNDIEYQY